MDGDTTTGRSGTLRDFSKIYFFYWAAYATLYPFLGMYYQSIGLDDMQIGYTGSLYAGASVAATLAISYFVDRFGRARKTLIFLTVLSVVTAVFIALAGKYSFALLLFCIFALALGLTPFSTITDEQLLKHLKKTEQSHTYAGYRRFGPIGYAAGIVLCGYLIQVWDVRIIFLLFPAVSLIVLFYTKKIPIAGSGDNGESFGTPGPTPTQIGKLFKLKIFYFSMACLTVWGLAESVFGQFLPLLLKHNGYSSSMTAWFIVASMAGEFFSYKGSVYLLKKITIPGIILLAFIMQLIRYTGLVYSKSMVLLLICQFAGGASFGLIWPAVTEALAVSVPASCAAVAHGCKSVMMSGAGYIIGYLLCGYFSQNYGIVEAFKRLSLFPACACVLLIIGRFLVLRKRTPRTD